MTNSESVEQRQAGTELAVDETYQTINEYLMDRRRVVFIDNNQKRQGSFGIVRQAHLHASSYLPAWIGSRLYGQPQVVAVKEITLSAMHDASDLKRVLTKEILVWSRLKGHPGIAKFLGFCADFGRKEVWLISPWESYGNVSEFIKGRELEVPEKLGLAYDTLDALEFPHNLNPPVCHGDIKSANVLVNLECRAVLCDLGLARLCEDIGVGSLENTAAANEGSIRWCSPEVLEGRPRTASSDIYAWAWLAWGIATGELPYEETNADDANMRKIFEGHFGQVNGESCPKDFLQLIWDLMTRCWSAEPLQRPTSRMCKTIFEHLPHCPPTPKTPDSYTRSPALLVNLGELESWKGNHRSGYPYLEQALALYKEEKNHEGIASVHRKKAAVAYRELDLVKLKSAASATLEKCRSLQDDIGVADALYWTGVCESTAEDAIRNFQESLKILGAKGNGVGIAKSLIGLGGAYRHKDEPTSALPVLEEAVDVASGCGDRLGEANALQALGDTHWELDQMDQAISAFQKARDIAQDIGWEHGLSSCLCRLGGGVKLQQKILAEAEGLFCESVRVARDSDGGWRLAEALWSLGRCLRAQMRHEEAILALEESCSVGQHPLDFDWELADAAGLIADSKSILGHKGEAVAWFDRAIAEWRKGGEELRISECMAEKDAILADMHRCDEGALRGEASS